MDYKETLDTLYNMLPDFQNIGAGAYKPGLERALEFNRYLGSPDRFFLSIHVAGTNGKGSVSHIIAAVLQSAGYRVGLYTSPHMRDFRERIKVDGQMIPERYVVDFTSEHMHKMHTLHMSFFEATMGMAFRYFADSDVEVAVIETGLGGRLDSTNIITPLISVITNIGMDHMAFLGDTPEKIALEKAGIIKPRVPVVIGESDPRSSPVFEKTAAEKGSPILFADKELECTGSAESENGKVFTVEHIGRERKYSVELDLAGNYQCKNVVTALAVVEVLNHYTQLSISSRAICSGCASAALSTGLQGRWQVVSHEPLIILDCGHNAHGLAETMRQVSAQDFDNLFIIFGVASDKDLDAILPLLPENARYIFTKASVNRAMPAEQLAEKASRHGIKGETTHTVAEAMELARSLAAPGDMIFIGGSSFVVGDALGELSLD